MVYVKKREEFVFDLCIQVRAKNDWKDQKTICGSLTQFDGLN
jgi:hypothetical protein